MEMAKASEVLTFVVRDGTTVFEFENVPIDRIRAIRDQFSQNGHSPIVENKGVSGPNYERFKQKISPMAKKFLQILKENPGGLSADAVAEKLGYHSGTQIGGMTGGGIKKHAKNNGIELGDIYSVEVRFGEGKRIVLYKLGKAGAKLF